MQGEKFTKKDWALFREKIVDWQEAYMDRLNKEYIELLSEDDDPSEKFWKLDERIKKDKKSKQQYDDIEAALYKIYEREELEKDARIYVRGRIYPGVKVIISDCRYIVKETIQYCQFRRKGADVKMSSL